MKFQKASVKLYLTDDSDFDQEELTPIFHRWIREGGIKDQLLIDVADYRHVPKGPGIMLIAHEAHYGLDEGEGRPGLLYSDRRDPVGPGAEKLKNALARAAQCAALLEAEPSLKGRIEFRTDEFLIRVMDRLNAPNRKSSCELFEPVLRSVLGDLGFGDVKMERHSEEERDPFAVDIRVISASLSLGDFGAIV
jgi:hypothetical protein